MFAQAQSIRPSASTRASANSARPIVVARAVQPAQANAVPTPRQPIRDHSEKTIRLLKAGCVVTAASLALVSGLLICEPANANELGAQVFNGNCAACHMGGRNSVIQEKTLDKEALEKYLAGGFKLESIVYQVQNGKGAMPAWADRLDDDEIDAVAKYVFDKASTATWD